MTTPPILKKHFVKRSGTTNDGGKYEDLLTAYVAHELSVNSEVEDFSLSSNNKDYGSFDDIVLDVVYKNGTHTQHVVQLKHKQNPEAPITKDMLAACNGKFSIQKYFASFLDIKHRNLLQSNYKCVLFTNANFGVPNFRSFDFQLEGTSVIATVDQCPLSPEDNFLDTSNNNYAYKFKFRDLNASVDPELQEFGDHFYFNPNQKSYSELKEDFEPTYLDYISKWSEKEGRKACLSKMDIKLKIAEIMLNPFIKSSSSVSYSRLYLINGICALHDIVNVRQTIKLDEFYAPLVDIYETEILGTLPQNHKHISNLDVVEAALILWHLGKAPLVIEVDENNTHKVYEAINFFEENERKFVLCGTIDKTRLSKFKIFQCLSDLDSNAVIYDRICQDTNISLQGRKSISLADMIKSDENFSRCITSDELLKSDLINIGEEKEELPTPYIEQFLPKNTISFEFFNDPQIHSVSVINCHQPFTKISKIEIIKIDEFLKKEMDELLHKKVVIVAENECTEAQFEEISKKCGHKTCHLFAVNDQEDLEWIKTKGSISELRKFVEVKSVIEEDKIFGESNHKMNFISGRPGAGKTVMFKNLKNTLPPEYWVIKINLRDHLPFFLNQKSTSTFLEYLLRFQANSFNFDSCTLELRTIFEEKKKIVFLFDALDELPVHIDTAISNIYQLSQMGFICWITTRDHLQLYLEDTFSIFSFTIKEMDRKQQECYIGRHLETKFTPDELKVIIKKITDTIALTKDVGFLGIPLRMYMLINLFLHFPEKYKELLDRTFTLTDLIQHFVKGKFRFCYEDKGKFEMNHFTKKVLKGNREFRVGQYEILALKTFLPLEILNELNINYKKVLQDVGKENTDDFGIITRINPEDDIVHFEHNVYGEYFVASWMVKNMHLVKKLTGVIFEENYTNIRTMFDLILAKNCPAHIAVLHKDYENLSKYKEEIDLKDRGGRTPLHLACSWGQRHPLLDPVEEEEGQWFLTGCGKADLVVKDDEAYNKILNFLTDQNRCNPLEKDHLLEWNCLDYADNRLSLLPLDVLSATCHFKTESLRNFKDLCSVAYYCVMFNYRKLFEHLQTIYYVINKETGNNLLHIAVILNHNHFIDKIFDNSLYKARIDEKNRGLVLQLNRHSVTQLPSHQNALHLAVFTGNVDIVYKLIKNGAQIDCPDVNGNTALHLAAMLRNPLLIKLLLREGADVNIKDKTDNTALHFVVSLGDADLVNEVLEKKAYISKNKINQTPLDFAVIQNFPKIVDFVIKKGLREHSLDDFLFDAVMFCIKNNRIEMLECLLRNKVKVNKVNLHNITPLHAAIIHNNVTIVELLLKYNANSNHKGQNEMNALLYALYLGHIEISKILIRNGADIHGVDCDGVTCLILAVIHRNIQLINLLMKYQIDVNKQDRHGISALHVAAAAGKIEIIDILLKNKSKIKLEDYGGNTPLHYAAAHGKEKAYKFLIKKGAIKSKKNKNRNTPKTLRKNPSLFGGPWIDFSRRVVRESVESEFQVNLKNITTPAKTRYSGKICIISIIIILLFLLFIILLFIY